MKFPGIKSISLYNKMNKVQNHKSITEIQFLLAVVISCKALPQVLEKNLKALSRQDLNPELFQSIFIFKEKDRPLQKLIKKYLSSYKIMFLPENKPLYDIRNLALRTLNSPYIYFIDEDVILENTQHLSRLMELHKRFPQQTVIGGTYLDHPHCSFFGRSYNFVVRLWTKYHKNRLPAGNLSVKTQKKFKAQFYSPTPQGFGGEEVYFLNSLYSEGHSCLWDKSLDTPHLASHSFKVFAQRAWLHGISRALEKKNPSSSPWLFFKEPAPFLIKISAFFLSSSCSPQLFFIPSKKPERLEIALSEKTGILKMI